LSGYEATNLDLSVLTFEQFVEFFFAREVVSDDEIYQSFRRDPSGQTYDETIPSSPAVVVAHMTRLFSEFGGIAAPFSIAQLDQGVWGLLGASFSFDELLWDSAVPLPDRVQCIRSMYFVFSDFVAVSLKNTENGFFMWWDLILHDFWCHWELRDLHRDLRSAMDPESDVSLDVLKVMNSSRERRVTATLDPESRLLLDVMFETLKRTLELPDPVSRDCALHGFGHLSHPDVRETVQQFIDAHQSELTGDRLRWVEACRDGTVL
jgi:hypothetical protein